MRVKRVRNYTLAIYDPVPYNCTSEAFEDWKSVKRTPLVCAVCEKDGYFTVEITGGKATIF
jgi:hypothetical protein